MNTTPSKIKLPDAFGGYDYATSAALLASRIHNAGVPFVQASKGRFGGTFWLCVSLSLDARDTWAHGIYENSRCAKLAVTLDGKVGARVASDEAKFVVSCFSGGSKRDFPNKAFRKFRVRTLEEVADRIADWALVNNLSANVAAKRLSA